MHESSVKRWCNAEALDYWLTPGGHRRIPLRSLLAFARVQEMDVPLLGFPGYEAEVWEGVNAVRRNNDFHGLINLVYQWIGDERTELPIRLVYHLVEEGYTLADLFDKVVGPVMFLIGMGYTQGDLSIGDEHRMTQTMRDTLIAARRPALHPAEDAPIALVGCARDEVHELGALMVRLALEEQGWRVVYLGLNVPTEEFATQQVQHEASLVCISMMPPMGLPEARVTIRTLASLYDFQFPYRLVIGGSALPATDATADGKPILTTRFFNHMVPFSEWLQQLRVTSPVS